MIFIVIAPQLGVCAAAAAFANSPRVFARGLLFAINYTSCRHGRYSTKEVLRFVCMTLRDNQRPNGLGLFDAVT